MICVMPSTAIYKNNLHLPASQFKSVVLSQDMYVRQLQMLLLPLISCTTAGQLRRMLVKLTTLRDAHRIAPCWGDRSKQCMQLPCNNGPHNVLP